MALADVPPRALELHNPPAIVAPGPRQTSFGKIVAELPRGTERVGLFVDGELVRDQAAAPGEGRFAVNLPRGDSRIRVVVSDGAGNTKADSVGKVLGLPQAGRPTGTEPRLERHLQKRLKSLAAAFPGITGFYVMNLRTGQGAGWNARARFPAASTVKLAIAVEVMRRVAAIPEPGSWLRMRLRAMLVRSGNLAANELLTWIGGSTTAGASAVTSMLRSVGIRDTYLYGGYILGTANTGSRPIPLNVVAQPSFSGKYTSAWDLARTHRYLHSATAGRGPLITDLTGFTRSEARSLMYLLAHSADRGKLDRFVRDDAAAVPHKAGWISTSRHDAGIVYWPGGSFVAAVMTWNGNGIPETSADILAGRMAQAALRRFQALGRATGQAADERAILS